MEFQIVFKHFTRNSAKNQRYLEIPNNDVNCKYYLEIPNNIWNCQHYLEIPNSVCCCPKLFGKILFGNRARSAREKKVGLFGNNIIWKSSWKYYFQITLFPNRYGKPYLEIILFGNKFENYYLETVYSRVGT